MWSNNCSIGRVYCGGVITVVLGGFTVGGVITVVLGVFTVGE